MRISHTQRCWVCESYKLQAITCVTWTSSRWCPWHSAVETCMRISHTATRLQPYFPRKPKTLVSRRLFFHVLCLEWCLFVRQLSSLCDSFVFCNMLASAWRIVVNKGAGAERSGSVRSSHHSFRRLERLVLPYILTQVFHPSWYETCSYATTFLNERMWHLPGVKTYSSLLHIFGWSGLPNSPWSMPLVYNMKHRLFSRLLFGFECFVPFCISLITTWSLIWNMCLIYQYLLCLPDKWYGSRST